MTNNYVSVNGLSVKFQQEILEGVFLEMKKEELVSIVGKSGVGKTTLLNAIAGLVDFKGAIKKPAKTSMVFQNPLLFPWMTVKENIAFGSYDKGEKMIQEIINSTGLDGKENYYPAQLSGGQQQRVAIGRALAAKPDLLLLDEPFANLDGYTKFIMQEWINNLLQKYRTTAILVTHDIEEAIILSDRVMLMRNKILAHEYWVPFSKPRKPEIRYSQQFQQLKKDIYANY